MDNTQVKLQTLISAPGKKNKYNNKSMISKLIKHTLPTSISKKGIQSSLPIFQTFWHSNNTLEIRTLRRQSLESFIHPLYIFH